MITKAKPQVAPSRLDPEPVSRRGFLGIASIVASASAIGFAALGLLRLPKAAVLSSPSKKFKVALPDSLVNGEPYIPPGRSIALFKDEEGVFAVSLICTHLGCIVKSNPDGFECPCHGSRFTLDGTLLGGPAPGPLVWHEMSGSDGNYVVDEGKTVPPGTKLKA